MPEFFRTLLGYLLPATILHFLGLVAYDLLWLADLTGPLDQFVRNPSQESILYIVVYLVVVVLVAVVAYVQRWNVQLPWLIELGVRRGLHIRGVPVIDIGLLFACSLLVLALGRYDQRLSESAQPATGVTGTIVLALYLVGPLMFALLISLLTGRPQPPHDIITDDAIHLWEYADQEGLDRGVLALANGFKEQDNPEWTFGQKIRRPVL